MNEIHRPLTAEEEKEFQQWARDNYVRYTKINGLWHPALQAECVKINEEGTNKKKEEK